jgi:CXXC-20-CXXC protein
MGLQNCEKCKSQFNRSKIFKSLWVVAYRPIQCSRCGTKHMITFSSRILISLLTIPPMMLFGYFLLNKWSLSISFTVLIMIIFGVLLSMVFPYLVKYSSDD